MSLLCWEHQKPVNIHVKDLPTSWRKQPYTWNTEKKSKMRNVNNINCTYLRGRIEWKEALTTARGWISSFLVELGSPLKRWGRKYNTFKWSSDDYSLRFFCSSSLTGSSLSIWRPPVAPSASLYTGSSPSGPWPSPPGWSVSSARWARHFAEYDNGTRPVNWCSTQFVNVCFVFKVSRSHIILVLDLCFLLAVLKLCPNPARHNVTL